MPYIKKEKRPQFEPVIREMFNAGLGDGDGNKIIKILVGFCRVGVNLSYNNLKNYCGELDRCAGEIARRAVEIARSKKTRPVWDRVADTESVIQKMLECEVKVDGDLNYILFVFCRRHLKNWANFCEVLRRAREDIVREDLNPYEDQKIKENGDAV